MKGLKGLVMRKPTGTVKKRVSVQPVIASPSGAALPRNDEGVAERLQKKIDWKSSFQDRVIVALDTDDFRIFRKWVLALRNLVSFFKVGSELFTAVGLDAVRFIQDQGAQVFLDLKFHDIPNTVYRAARAAARLRVKMFNVHALGGLAMMRAAKRAVREAGCESWVLAVTVLTSLGERELAQDLGIRRPVGKEVLHLAGLAREAGLDGVVASGEEAGRIKGRFGRAFKVVTPGVRPLWAAKNDHSRLVTPRQAFEQGADYIVIGRPITGAARPRDAALRIFEEIQA